MNLVTSSFVMAFVTLATLALTPAQAVAQPEAVLQAYQGLHAGLAADDLVRATSSAKELKQAADKWVEAEGASHPRAGLIRQAAQAAEKAGTATTEAQARTQFASVSKAIVEFVRADTNLRANWQLFECTMASGYGFWIQPKGEEIANPYFGQEMLSCGSKRKW